MDVEWALTDCRHSSVFSSGFNLQILTCASFPAVKSSSSDLKTEPVTPRSWASGIFSRGFMVLRVHRTMDPPEQPDTSRLESGEKQTEKTVFSWFLSSVVVLEEMFQT